MRTALLSAVSHDLRTPLASAKAAVESLRSPDVDLDRRRPRRELLATAESPSSGSPAWWRTCWT